VGNALALQVLHNRNQLLAEPLQQVQTQPTFLPQTFTQRFLARRGEEQGRQPRNLEALKTLDDVLVRL